MAAGFTIETEKIGPFQEALEAYARKNIVDELLIRTLAVDLELPLALATEKLCSAISILEPFGIGNPAPTFVTRNLKLFDARLVGKEGKHLKLRVVPDDGGYPVDAIAFGLGSRLGELEKSKNFDMAYSLELNEWNGKRSVQLKVKDIEIPS